MYRLLFNIFLTELGSILEFVKQVFSKMLLIKFTDIDF